MIESLNIIEKKIEITNYNIKHLEDLKTYLKPFKN